MAEELGCNFSNATELKTHFEHPITNKLVRNCFGTQKGLHAATKLNLRYLEWKRRKCVLLLKHLVKASEMHYCVCATI